MQTHYLEGVALVRAWRFKSSRGHQKGTLRITDCWHTVKCHRANCLPEIEELAVEFFGSVAEPGLLHCIRNAAYRKVSWVRISPFPPYRLGQWRNWLYAQDLKSCGFIPCGFESHLAHHALLVLVAKQRIRNPRSGVRFFYGAPLLTLTNLYNNAIIKTQ